MWVDEFELLEFGSRSRTWDCMCWPSSLSRGNYKRKKSERRGRRRCSSRQ